MSVKKILQGVFHSSVLVGLSKIDLVFRHLYTCLANILHQLIFNQIQTW